MNPQSKQEKIKSIIIFIILAILLLLIIFSEYIITLQNKIGLSENMAKVGYTTTIGGKTYDITNAVAENENPPTISAGMIPVKWDGTYWRITSAESTTWYDYSSGKPAYMMLNDGVYQSELVQDMEGKKLAEKNTGAQVQETELGTIYMWLPRYAYNEQGEVLHIKQGYCVAGSWAMPEIFTYETDKIDFSLTGVWIEYKPVSSTSEVITKINNMTGEDNKYGFIANTKPISMAETDLTAIEKYSVGAGLASALKDITNLNRTILKIINTNQTEPIKARVEYNKETEKVEVELVYFKYGIKQVVTEKGKELIKTSTNTYELENLDDITYTYKIIDNEDNIKEVRINDIYIILDVESLNKFRDEVNAGNDFSGITVIQTANIDMSKVCSEELGSWTPIGATGKYFAGTYNGGYNTISNLYMNSNQYQNLGLFSKTTTSTIVKNMVMENVYIYNTYNEKTHSYTGAIIGQAEGTIENCGVNSGKITAVKPIYVSSYCDVYVGGIAGGYQVKSILQCYNKATISGTASTGNVHTRAYAGGIIGNGCNSIIENCYNTGEVYGIGRICMCWRNCRNEAKKLL